jgi:CRISPR-associated protein Csm1
VTLPTVEEVAVAGLLHDIGKLIQRAHGGQGLPQRVRDRAGDVLPQHQGRPSHWHALWSDLFFELCEGAGDEAEALPWPKALDRARVRTLAVYHHAPLQDYRTAPHLILSELVTRADRLAAGQERKARDAAAEADAEEGGGEARPDAGGAGASARRAFLDTPLRAIVSAVRLDRGAEQEHWHPPAALDPDAIRPVPRPDAAAMAQGYRAVWEAFRAGWRDLCARAGGDAAAFEEGLLSLSERTLWAVPSSTVDEPDVSLHDHARAVAAFAAALFRLHEAAGDLDDARALRDGARPKFRFLVGDLSGLQRTLFRLRSEGVAGLAKLLRGRSLRFQLIADAALRRALAEFGMPMSGALQTAGGRFLALVPALPDAEPRLDTLRAEADEWFAAQYAGDLALGLALSEPFAPWDLMPRPDETAPDAALARSAAVRDRLAIAIETAKLRQLEGPAAAAVLPLAYPAGDCPACGVRPAQGTAAGPGPCAACAAEIDTGARLPRARAVVIGARTEAADGLLGLSYLMPLGEGAADGGRGWRWLREAGKGPAPLRAGPAWVARFGDGDRERYAGLAKRAGLALEADEIEAGQIKTFQGLALDSCEDEGRQGRPMLALLKGDVDRLGRIFAQGLGPRWSVARTAALSRMLDGYFALRLPALLAAEFPDSYTVYAGGDDFVIVAPWRQGFALAVRLAGDFRAFAGENPDLTFSLGIALFDPRTPVSIAAREAEDRLEAAKAAGRNRVSALEAEPMTWDAFARALDAAERFNGWLRDGTLSTGALYRLLALDDARQRIAADERRRRIAEDRRRRGEGEGEQREPLPLARPGDYGWMGRLGYHLARLRPARGAGRMPPEVLEACRALFGIGPDWRPGASPPPGARLALTHALYRNR